MNVLGDGPIGFRVYGIGWQEGQPYVVCEVANAGKIIEYRIARNNGVWETRGTQLSDEEQQFLERVWHGQCDQLGIPTERRG
jgi:hypothetical protein